MEVVHVQHLLPCTCLVVLLHSSSPGLPALNGLPQIIKLPLVHPDKDELAPDFDHHALKGVGVCFAAEDDNIYTTLAGVLMRIELFRVCRLRESDVVGGQKKDPLALAALAEE